MEKTISCERLERLEQLKFTQAAEIVSLNAQLAEAKDRTEFAEAAYAKSHELHLACERDLIVSQRDAKNLRIEVNKARKSADTWVPEKGDNVFYVRSDGLLCSRVVEGVLVQCAGRKNPYSLYLCRPSEQEAYQDHWTAQLIVGDNQIAEARAELAKLDAAQSNDNDLA